MYKHIFLFSNSHIYYKFFTIYIQYFYNKVYFINNLDLLNNNWNFIDNIKFLYKGFFIKWYICITKFLKKYLKNNVKFGINYKKGFLKISKLATLIFYLKISNYYFKSF